MIPYFGAEINICLADFNLLLYERTAKTMEDQRHVHLNFMKSSDAESVKKDHDNPRQEEYYEFELKEYLPEIYDCEADGSCSSGHQHVNTKL